MSHQHEKINYVEYPACNLDATKRFFSAVFGWKFTDYGPDYAAFDKQGIEGGFYQSALKSDSDKGAALIVFYSANLTQTYEKILANGGDIKTDIFAFPGGRDFILPAHQAMNSLFGHKRDLQSKTAPSTALS